MKHRAQTDFACQVTIHGKKSDFIIMEDEVVKVSHILSGIAYGSCKFGEIEFNADFIGTKLIHIPNNFNTLK